jgi:hypothetical protein
MKALNYLKSKVRFLRAFVVRCFGRCTWTYLSEEGNYYETSCGASFVFNDDTAEKNGFVYCYKCGKRIKTVEYDYGFDNEE